MDRRGQGGLAESRDAIQAIIAASRGDDLLIGLSNEHTAMFEEQVGLGFR